MTLTATYLRQLATFILNNYKQAFKMLEELPPVLERAMVDLKIADRSVFDDWLREETAYLQGLKKEPAEETLQMEYLQKLNNLWKAE